MRHPTPVEIEDHLLKAPVGAVGVHLDDCAECSRVARAIETLGDPMTWEISALPDESELTSALPTLAPPGLEVRERIVQAERLRHSNPAAAVKICDDALALPVCADDSEEARHLSVLLLRERANALRVLGDLPGSHETIRRARHLADELLVGEYENAVLDYIEATVLYEQQDFHRIDELARRAEAVLGRFGDEERALKVRFLSAGVAYARGDLEKARTMYDDVLESMEKGSNPPLEAGLLSNLANCEVALARYDDARRHIDESARLYGELGMKTEVTRVRWLEARILAATGNLDAAEARFLGTKEEFLREGLELDAALVDLELIEVYQAEERGEEIVAIATRLASVFSEAGTRVSLAQVLATLRDAALRGDDLSAPMAEARTTIETMLATAG